MMPQDNDTSLPLQRVTFPRPLCVAQAALAHAGLRSERRVRRQLRQLQQPQRVSNRAFYGEYHGHRTEHLAPVLRALRLANPAGELVSHPLGDERRLQLGFLDLLDVECHGLVTGDLCPPSSQPIGPAPLPAPGGSPRVEPAYKRALPDAPVKEEPPAPEPPAEEPPAAPEAAPEAGAPTAEAEAADGGLDFGDMQMMEQIASAAPEPVEVAQPEEPVAGIRRGRKKKKRAKSLMRMRNIELKRLRIE